jgi:Bacterial regulatory proteins, luxR family
MNKQAAAQLGITEYTVQVHRGHIMRKIESRLFRSSGQDGGKAQFPQPVGAV